MNLGFKHKSVPSVATGYWKSDGLFWFTIFYSIVQNFKYPMDDPDDPI